MSLDFGASDLINMHYDCHDGRFSNIPPSNTPAEVDRVGDSDVLQNPQSWALELNSTDYPLLVMRFHKDRIA